MQCRIHTRRRNSTQSSSASCGFITVRVSMPVLRLDCMLDNRNYKEGVNVESCGVTYRSLAHRRDLFGKGDPAREPSWRSEARDADLPRMGDLRASASVATVGDPGRESLSEARDRNLPRTDGFGSSVSPADGDPGRESLSDASETNLPRIGEPGREPSVAVEPREENRPLIGELGRELSAEVEASEEILLSMGERDS